VVEAFFIEKHRLLFLEPTYESKGILLMINAPYKSVLSDLNIRSPRFRYRHSVGAAAAASEIPATWIWAWLLVKRLKSQTWLRKVWVRLEDVQELLADRKAVREAFFATGDRLAPQAIPERKPDAGKGRYITFKIPIELTFSKPLRGETER
jgi:hypothetical protein